jgi:hypothetical protein
MSKPIGLDWAKRTLKPNQIPQGIKRTISIWSKNTGIWSEIDSLQIIQSKLKNLGIKTRKCFSKGKDKGN